MASFANPHLRRRLAALTAASRDKVGRREFFRDRARAEASIAAALVHFKAADSDLDPERISAVLQYRGAARQLAGLGDSPEIERADAAFAAGDPELTARAAKRAAYNAEWFARYAAGDPPPDPGAAAMAWYAWSVAQKP